MKMKYSETTPVLTTIIIIILVIVAYLSFEKYKKCFLKQEKFADFKEYSKKKCGCSNTKRYDFTLEDKGGLKFNGIIFKNFINSKKHRYTYKFNLPIPYGGDYIDKEGKYCVYVSHKDKNNLNKIGELNKTNDGWFYLEHLTSKKIKYTKITLENNSDDKKVIFKKKLY